VGFVVDDAIVHAREHRAPRRGGARSDGGRLQGLPEVGFTIISMTLSLVAVFHPRAVHGRRGGRMFNEFGLVISFAIPDLGVVSLTLTPMLCSRLLKPIDHHEKHNVLLRSFEWSFKQDRRRLHLGA